MSHDEHVARSDIDPAFVDEVRRMLQRRADDVADDVTDDVTDETADPIEPTDATGPIDGPRFDGADESSGSLIELPSGDVGLGGGEHRVPWRQRAGLLVAAAAVLGAAGFGLASWLAADRDTQQLAVGAEGQEGGAGVDDPAEASTTLLPPEDEMAVATTTGGVTTTAPATGGEAVATTEPPAVPDDPFESVPLTAPNSESAEAVTPTTGPAETPSTPQTTGPSMPGTSGPMRPDVLPGIVAPAGPWEAERTVVITEGVVAGEAYSVGVFWGGWWGFCVGTNYDGSALKGGWPAVCADDPYIGGGGAPLPFNGRPGSTGSVLVVYTPANIDGATIEIDGGGHDATLHRVDAFPEFTFAVFAIDDLDPVRAAELSLPGEVELWLDGQPVGWG